MLTSTTILEAEAEAREQDDRADLARAMLCKRTAKLVKRHRLRPLVDAALADEIDATSVLDALAALGEARSDRRAARARR